MKFPLKSMCKIFMLGLVFTLSACATNLQERVLLNDPANYRLAESAHDGAGPMDFTGIIGSSDVSSNFLYLHAGMILPKGGIGHHFHHSIEEMYVLLSGEAEFTVNGHTSLIEAPVIVPNKLGSSHGLVNTSDESLRWLNFAVSEVKGRGDAFDLGDNRVGAGLDPVPVFVYGRLDKEPSRRSLFEQSDDEVKYFRVLGPEVFSTNWNHVDQIILPEGSSTDSRQLVGIEEIYYVMEGSGTMTVDEEEASINRDEAFSISMRETISISNNGPDDLKILVIGVRL